MIFPTAASRVFRLMIGRVASRRAPDFVVGADNPEGAYLNRWWVIPRNWLFNVYLHEFLRDDDDRALHDHPWWSLSFMLSGSYIEHTISAGGIHRREMIEAGALRLRSPRHAHRIELERYAAAGHRNDDGTHRVKFRSRRCWTLFITGPKQRRWGFHCSERGWVDFALFTKPGATGETGAGCDA